MASAKESTEKAFVNCDMQLDQWSELGANEQCLPKLSHERYDSSQSLCARTVGLAAICKAD